MNLQSLARELRESRGFAHKADIAPLVSRLGLGATAAIPVGDDCAAIPDGDGFLLLAIEGFLNSFVAADPAFAGYCGVMVNLSDIAAMGGRPIAVVDALWSRDEPHARPILDGLAHAAGTYGVPIVGGHSNTRNNTCDVGEQLAVAVLGRAQCLLTSFDAKPGNVLLAAIDLRGRYREPHPYWDASSAAAASGLGRRLRDDLELLPQLAESGLCRAAKDISMAGVIGTALMLAETSGVGMTIEPELIPRPPGAELGRWLSCFPSFGFLLAADPANVPAVITTFTQRNIACAAIGVCDRSSQLVLSAGGETATVWNLAETPLIGCNSPTFTMA
jgi:AIR synthase-related protein